MLVLQQFGVDGFNLSKGNSSGLWGGKPHQPWLAIFLELMSRIKTLVGSILKNAVHTVYEVIMSSTINRNNEVKGTGNSKGDGVAFGKGCWDTAASPRS